MTRFIYITMFFFLVCLANLAKADYTVTPVKVFFGNNDKVASVTLNNTNDDEASFQLALYKWSRVDGKDVYEESNDFTVTPKMFKVQPNSSQLIRIAPKNNSKTGVEKAYRLFMKELPSRGTTENNAINVVLQFGVPIFVEPSKKEGALNCTATTKGEKFDLTCKNNHNQHTLLSTMEFTNNEETVSKQEINRYVFPSETVTVSLEKPEHTEKLTGNLVSYFKGSKIETPINVN